MDKNPKEKYLEKIEIEELQQKDKVQKEIDEFNKNFHLEIFLPNQYKCFSQVELNEITYISIQASNCVYIKNLITGDKVKIFHVNIDDISNSDTIEEEIDKELLLQVCSHFNNKIEERIKWLKTYLSAIELLSTKNELEI